VILKRRQIEPESGNQLRVNLCVRFRS
jgi:hypothetical protein